MNPPVLVICLCSISGGSVPDATKKDNSAGLDGKRAGQCQRGKWASRGQCRGLCRGDCGIVGAGVGSGVALALALLAFREGTISRKAPHGVGK